MGPALSVIVTAAVERTGSANDGAERGGQAIGQKLALAREAEKDAKAIADADEAATKAECASGARPSVLGSKPGPMRAGPGTRWRKPALSPRFRC